MSKLSEILQGQKIGVSCLCEDAYRCNSWTCWNSLPSHVVNSSSVQ